MVAQVKVTIHKQVGGMDCGIFAIAAVTAFAFNMSYLFLNNRRCDHTYLTCFKNQKFTLFSD